MKAIDAQPNTHYTRPGGPIGGISHTFVKHSKSREVLIANLKARRSELRGREVGLLRDLEAGGLPFSMHPEGMSARTVVLQPNEELALPKPPPGPFVAKPYTSPPGAFAAMLKGEDWPVPNAVTINPAIPDGCMMVGSVLVTGINENFETVTERISGEPAIWQRLIGTTVAPGTYTNAELSNEDYHAAKALSSTGLKKIERSVDHYLYARQKPEKKKAFDFGHGVHALVLEGESAFLDLCEVSPHDSYRTKAAKEWRAEVEAQGKIVLTAYEMREIERAAEAVDNHPTASRILCTGQPETSYFWTEDVDGVPVPCRARCDWQRDGMIVDLKTTRDASPRAFNKSVLNFNYAASLAFYQRGVEAVTGERPEDVVIIAVENSAPYGVGVYQLSEDWLEIGRRKCDEWLETVAEWLTAAEPWTGYETGIQLLEPPNWA